jgi:hypothetical protein
MVSGHLSYFDNVVAFFPFFCLRIRESAAKKYRKKNHPHSPDPYPVFHNISESGN